MFYVFIDADYLSTASPCCRSFLKLFSELISDFELFVSASFGPKGETKAIKSYPSEIKDKVDYISRDVCLLRRLFSI